MHPYPPPQRPPGAPKVFGILSIIFGCLVVVTSLFGIASAFSGKPMFTPDMPGGGEGFARALEQFHRDTRWASLAQGLVMTVMSVALILIGNGQMKYRRWAAGASVKWGIVALLVLVGQAIVNFTIMGPAMDRYMKALIDAMPNSGSMPDLGGVMGGAMKFGLFAGLVVNAVYPILLIVTFRKPRNVDAMIN